LSARPDFLPLFDWSAIQRPELRQTNSGAALAFRSERRAPQPDDLLLIRISALAAPTTITLLAFELRHAILQYACGQVIP
jgi:hypothetical protein